MLAKIKVYDSSPELQRDIGTIKIECKKADQACILISKETKSGRGSAAYLVTDARTSGYFGRKIDSSIEVPSMAIIPRGDETETYGMDSRGFPIKVDPYLGSDHINIVAGGSVQYYTNGHTLEGDDAHDALLEKDIFAGSVHDLLNHLGMDKPIETEQVLGSSERDQILKKYKIDIVK